MTYPHIPSCTFYDAHLEFTPQSTCLLKNGQEFIPLIDIAQMQEPEHVEQFILKYLKSPVVIQPGTTLTHFLVALQPWAQVLSFLTDRNILAYIEACRTPILVPEQTSTDSYIRLYTQYELSPHVEYHFPDESDDLLQTLKQTPTKTITDTFDIQRTLCASYFCTEDQTEYGLMGSFDKIKSLPLILDTDEQIYIDKTLLKSTSSDPQQKYDILQHKSESFTLDDVIQSLIVYGLFFQYPSGHTYFSQKIDQIEQQEENINKPALHVVTDKDETEDQHTLSVSEHAFDDVIHHLSEQDKIWQQLLETYQKSASIVFVDFKKPRKP